ncbi:MAG: copper amine oxidase N-terminal domain-containing protein [Tissierellia bacterium]|nr:copper amine oxidase N-terminal domain-containing protein [Tissierellia bacterium]
MKKRWTFLILLVFLTITTVYGKAPTIELNGEEIKSEVPPFIEESRTYVPLRFVSEALHYTVGWDNDTRQVTVDGNGKTLLLTIGSKKMTVNGVEKIIDVAPLIRQERSYVPLRFIAEHLGIHVGWDEKNAIVQLSTDKTDAISVTGDENIYLESFDMHEQRIAQLMEEFKSIFFKETNQLSRENIEAHYDRIKREIDTHIAGLRDLNVPKKFETVHAMTMEANQYLQEMLPQFKTAILNTNEEAAKNIIHLITQYNVKMTEVHKALKASLEGKKYHPDKDIEVYNEVKKDQNDTHHLLEDQGIQKLLQQL